MTINVKSFSAKGVHWSVRHLLIYYHENICMKTFPGIWNINYSTTQTMVEVQDELLGNCVTLSRMFPRYIS